MRIQVTRKTRNRARARTIALQLEYIRRLKEELHRSLVRAVSDLKVASGLLEEKDREKAEQQMADPKRFPSESLDALRKAILALMVRNHAHPATESTDPPVRSDYIQ